MKLYFNWGLKNLLRNSKFKSQLKFASTQQSECDIFRERAPVEKFLSPFKIKNCIIPNLKADRIQMLGNVTGIAVKLNHVCWARISTPTLTVSSWDAYKLPDNFSEEMNDIAISEAAQLIVSQIPMSDLYVMECRLARTHQPTSHICLRSMLVMLLNNLFKDSKNDTKIVFLKHFLLNNLHQLLVGNERISIKQVLERKSVFMSKLKTKNKKKPQALENNDTMDCYSSVNIQDELINFFFSREEKEKEGLSHSLILALTFLDVYFFQNSQSIEKILNKKKSGKKM